MNKVSVIIPVYNTLEFLEDCIDSVLNQTYTNLEIILINDNSNEECSKFISEIEKNEGKIKGVYLKERVGVGAARNFGVQHSNGDFIYFLDSDDVLRKDTIQLLVDYIADFSFISGKQIGAHNIEKEDVVGIEEKTEEIDMFIYSSDRFKLIRNNSVLHRLFRKDFILENDLKFAEEVERYSDLAFMVPALLSVEETPYLKQSIYYKRRRNDSISNPSLMQVPAEDRINDYLYMFNYLKDKYNDDALNYYLDNRLLNYYRKTIVTFFKKNENVDAVFSNLVKSVKRVNPHAVQGKSRVLKREIKALLSGDIQKYKKLNLNHQRLRKAKNAIKTKRKFYIQLYRSVFLKMPMKENLIVFESFLAKSYSDSPKYIFEYMINHKMDYEYVWIYRDKKKSIPGNPIQVKRFSLKYYYYLARAKYWVNNSRMPKSLNKRQGNIYLQTWHGTPLKTLVFDIKNIYSADPRYKRNFYQQSRRWDYLSSPNQYSSDIFRRAFKFEKEMLEFGYPRNDILYQKNNDKDILNLKRKIRIPPEKKVILYAPTWRDDEFYAPGQYKFALQLDLKKLRQKLGDEYIVLLRMHYFIASQLDISDYKGFAYDFSSYDDIAELYLVSDILITDYSSVFFDYANLQRPILFYTYDLEKYRDKLRGFYIDMEKEVPGPLLKTTDEIISTVKNINRVKEEYKEKYDYFYDRFCKWDDGEASRKTVERVFWN